MFPLKISGREPEKLATDAVAEGASGASGSGGASGADAEGEGEEDGNVKKKPKITCKNTAAPTEGLLDLDKMLAEARKGLGSSAE